MSNYRHRPTGLYRDPANAHIMGVCAGIAEKLEFDVNIIRAAAFFAIIFSGIIPGLVVYAIIGLVLPPRSKALRGRTLGDNIGEVVTTVENGIRDTFEDTRDTRQSRREARRREKEELRADKEEAKRLKKQGIKPGSTADIAMQRASLKRRFSDMERRTSMMEQEVTSQRFKLERDLKKLEEV